MVKPASNPGANKTLKAWIPSLIWLIIIAIESTDLLSSSNESRLLYPLITFLFGHIDLDKFMVWNGYLREVGHFVGYFVLSCLQFWAWRATILLPNAKWSFRWARIAFLTTAMVATLDEWHQSFIPSRTGRFHDVVLDSSAALIAQVIIYFWLRSRSTSNLITEAEAQSSS